jgi:hypothetical protein
LTSLSPFLDLIIQSRFCVRQTWDKSLLPLFEADQDGQNKKYTFEYVIERLKSIRKETVEIEGVTTSIITECDEEQQLILDCLNIKLK